MSARYDGIDPGDIDPDTGQPYPNYSSPALDTSFHDHEMAIIDDRMVDSDDLTAEDVQRMLAPLVDDGCMVATATGYRMTTKGKRLMSLLERQMGGS